MLMEASKSSVHCDGESLKDLSTSQEKKNVSLPDGTDMSENKGDVKAKPEVESSEPEIANAESSGSSNTEVDTPTIQNDASISAKIKTMHVQDTAEACKLPETAEPPATDTKKPVALSLAPETDAIPSLGTKPSFFNKPRMPFFQADNSAENSTSAESSDIMDVPKSKKPRLFGSATADVLEKSGGNYFSLALKDCAKIGELTSNLKEKSTFMNAPKPKALFGESNDTGVLSNDTSANIITGEEDETNVLKIVGKLYIFSSESGVWKERGRGILRLNEKFVDGKAVSRLVMRASGSLRVILNSLIFSAMDVTRTSETTVRFSAQYNDSIKIFSIRASAADCERLVDQLNLRVKQSADPKKAGTMERKWLRLVFLKPCKFVDGVPADTSLNFSLEEYLINNDWIQYIVKLNDDSQTFFDQPLSSAFSFENVNKQLKIELMGSNTVYKLQFLDMLDLTEVHTILDRIMKSEFSIQRKFRDNSIHSHWVPSKKSKQETSNNDETEEKEESKDEREEEDEEDDSDEDDKEDGDDDN